MKSVLASNHNYTELLEPRLRHVRNLPDQFAVMLDILDTDYGGDFENFYADLKADSSDLRLRSSHHMGAQINPTPAYNPPLSQAMDGYATSRRKHEARIMRLTAPPSSARGDGPGAAASGSDSTSRRESTRRSATTATNQYTSVLNHRTKGDIPEYGNFSGWSKYRQLNASAMIDR